MFKKGHPYFLPKNKKQWLKNLKNTAKKRRGIPLTEEHKEKLRLAKINKPLKGGIKYNKNGYRYIFLPHHPFKQSGKYYAEHRYNLENYLKKYDKNNEALIEVDGIKYLKNDWIVHHINRIKTDNRHENLIAMPRKKHYGHIITCPFCNKIFNY